MWHRKEKKNTYLNVQRLHFQIVRLGTTEETETDGCVSCCGGWMAFRAGS
mgnify:CR=1 FL=1